MSMTGSRGKLPGPARGGQPIVLTLNRATGSPRHCKQHGGLGMRSNGLQQQEAAPLEGLAPMRPGHGHSLQAGQLT